MTIAMLAWCISCASDTGGVGGAGAAGSDESGEELAHRFMIVDTHIDVPYRLREKMEDIGERTAGGDFDFPRAREGGLDVAFMSIYVPAKFQTEGDPKQVADELIDMVEGIVADHPDKFEMVASVADSRKVFGNGKVAFALGMENGAGIAGSLDNLRHFHERGVRYITLAHSKTNRICDSSYDEERQWNGLSPFGRELVAEMNRLGVMIDVSHVSDDAFYQILEVTRAPVLATHSSCRHFTPGWERNMSDEMIEALAKNGGVIQINFGSSFISDEYRLKRSAAREEIRSYLEAQGIERDSDHAGEYTRKYYAEHPIEYATLDDVADHIDHVVKLVGVDHVGLGSDFDGVGDSLPTGLKDVSDFPNLIDELLERGYSLEDVEKICSGNTLRVWTEVERIAAESAGGGA